MTQFKVLSDEFIRDTALALCPGMQIGEGYELWEDDGYLFLTDKYRRKLTKQIIFITLQQVVEMLVEKRKTTTAQMDIYMKEKPNDKQNQMAFEQRLNVLQELIGDMQQSKL